MCGICGVIKFGGPPLREVIAPVVLDTMVDIMQHRGPNDRGVHVEAGAALGVRRLSIVDIEGGHQPVANEDRSIWAIQNGELYNYRLLRQELVARGHNLETWCDTEIIPHLYEQYGDEFVTRLRGMFGIALWDSNRARAVVVRDRLGVKPIYYAVAADRVVFASELKSLLASGIVDGTIDEGSVAAFLALGFVPGPRTLLSGVSKLMPGERLVVDRSGVHLSRYWNYPLPAPEAPARSIQVYAEELLVRLEEAVRLRLMSDVPLGAMLSGGLDSSLITALMARNMKDPVKTFAVGFGGASEGNELSDAKLVAQTLGAEHHELSLGLDATLDIDGLVWSLDEPIADLSTVGFAALSQLAAQHVTVALSGQGADELLGGYGRHRAAALVGKWQRLPIPLASFIGMVGGRSRRVQSLNKRARLDPIARILAPKEPLRAQLPEPLRSAATDAASRAVADRLGSAVGVPLEQLLYVDGQLGLVDDMLHYFDRLSMAHSLEVRVPFLDHELVEFCATIPARYKVRRLTTKYILKQAACGLVPNEIIEKPKIGFFNGAVAAWTNRALDGVMAERLLPQDAAVSAFVGAGTAGELMTLQRTHPSRARAELLLSLLMLEVWLSEYLPRALGAHSEAHAAATG